MRALAILLLLAGTAAADSSPPSTRDWRERCAARLRAVDGATVTVTPRGVQLERGRAYFAYAGVDPRPRAAHDWQRIADDNYVHPGAPLYDHLRVRGGRYALIRTEAVAPDGALTARLRSLLDACLAD